MKRHVLWVILQLLYCTTVFGQTDDPGCNKLVIGSDRECSAAPNCNSLIGCTSYTFHVDCGGTYKLKAIVDCGENNCGHCASCVSIYTDPPGVAPVATVNTLSVCGNNLCADSTNVTSMTSGNYIMYVCLIPCTDEEEDIDACCEEFIDICKAYGCLEWGTSGAGCL